MLNKIALPNIKHKAKKSLSALTATVIKRSRELINGEEWYRVELEYKRSTPDGKTITERETRNVNAQVYAAIAKNETIILRYDDHRPNQTPALDLTALRQS